MDLFSKIADASLDEPEFFAENVLDILCEEFPIKAASLYSYQPEGKILILRGQSGLDYKAYKSFELPISTLAGEPIRTGNAFTTQDVSISSEYRDKDLVKLYALKPMVAVLMQMKKDSGNDSPAPMGVICAYPTDARDITSISSRLQEVAPFIARLYSGALDQIKIRLRKIFVERAGYSHDMSGLLHRTVRTFKESIQVEAASILLQDRRNSFLRLRATTGTRTMVQRNIFYVKESGDITNLSFRNNKMVPHLSPSFDGLVR